MRARSWLALTVWIVAASLVAAEEPAYRTDGGNEKLLWYQLVPGEFPPEGSGHYIAGELVSMDHVNRTGEIRVDRNESRNDRLLAFTMLPYGIFRYHGSPAELRDIPIGTHLHGQFYANDNQRKDGTGPFSRVLQFEDDFSYYSRLGKSWRIDAVALDKGTLTVTLVGPAENQAEAKPVIYQINPATRVWRGRSQAALSDLAAGQTVQVNLTVCTLKGPGRCTDIWLDQESRDLAIANQREKHRLYQREHGLAARVDEVDNKENLITVTLFAGFDPELLKEMPKGNYIAAAAAEESLRTYDQINDVMHGTILEVQEVPRAPGNSGTRLKFNIGTLIEGYRPKRVVRIFAGGWRVDDLPIEERLYQ